MTANQPGALQECQRRRPWLVLYETDMPSCDGEMTVVKSPGCVRIVLRKGSISFFLFTTLWATNTPPGVSRGKHHVEELLVVGLPGIEKNKIKRAWQAGNLGERVALNDIDDIGQARRADVGCRLLCATCVVLDGDHASTAFTCAEPEPDSAVAARGADLQHRFGAARRNEHAKESPVLFGYRQLPAVGRLDVAQQGFNSGIQRTGRPTVLRSERDEAADRQDAQHEKAHAEFYALVTY